MYKIWKQYALDALDRGTLIREIISRFISFDNITLLDIGCGEGGISISFAKAGKKRVYSIDISHDRVERACVRAKEEGAEVSFLIADAGRLPFISSTFDVVICNDVIEHVEKPERLMNEIYRVIKSSGVFYLTAPNRISPYQIIHDAHYGLFGLSLMPRRIAAYYVTKVRKLTNNYDVYEAPVFWYLKRIFRELDLKFIDCSGQYYLKKKLGPCQRFLVKNWLWGVFCKFVSPDLIFVCKKSDSV
jgi:2-polyprenyl-3-methyl-5-hydroxy-6-metoxy-1,4-benzoquinol methylase